MACTFSTSGRQKVARTPQFLILLTWKCASHHNGVYFFDISISKSGLRPCIFDIFDLEICFALQRHALFRHLNFQKWTEPGVLYIFWLGNVFRDIMAYSFSTSHFPKVIRTWDFDLEIYFAPQWRIFFRQLIFRKVRTWDIFTFFTYKEASRYNDVQFFISYLAN